MVIRITGSGSEPETQEESRTPPSPFHLFEDLFNDWAMRTAYARRREAWRPPVDILEKDNKLIIRTEIPGVEEKDIELKLDGHTLTVKGTRKPEAEESGYSYHQIEGSYGTFGRSFELPDSVDTTKVSATYDKGVLVITIPQRQEVKPRTIKING